MFDYKRLIHKSLKSHTLLSDTFGYGLIKMGFADKYLAGLVSMYKSYHWLQKKFGNELSKQPADVDKPKLEQKKSQKDCVWICWLQGMENAPQVVKECYHSIRYWLPDKEIVVITSDNYNEYVAFPNYIIEKWNKGIISNTHFSDLLRLELLIRYGGLWLDATTMLTGPLPKYIAENDFFVYRNGWMDMDMINMASWLIYSRRSNHLLLIETQKLLYKYWSKYSFIKNYFLLHMFFRMVCDHYPEQWNIVPYFNQVDNHLLMEELNKPYNPTRIEQIKALTTVHKLTYKFDESKDDCTVNHLAEISQNQ